MKDETPITVGTDSEEEHDQRPKIMKLRTIKDGKDIDVS
jgi:hypothetical protein